MMSGQEVKTKKTLMDRFLNLVEVAGNKLPDPATLFIILAIIIIQTYRMLVNPTDESNLKNLRKTFLYALIGMLVIGT